LELVNALIENSDSKKTTKAILKTVLDRIIFDKEIKSNFKIYMTFDQVIIDSLNEFMSSELTAELNAVGSFSLVDSFKIQI
jgi:site-specific DNA recombinase